MVMFIPSLNDNSNDTQPPIQIIARLPANIVPHPHSHSHSRPLPNVPIENVETEKIEMANEVNEDIYTNGTQP
jgi:hypothetical protein